MSSTTTDRIDGLSTSVAVKAPVKAVAVSNITLSGEQTVNGVAVVTGDRVLVTAQNSSVDNGIYDVSSSAWTRSADFDGNRDVVKGTLVVSNTGTSIYYRVTSADPIVIGTSAITFEVVSGSVTQSSIGAALYPRTAGEIAAGITPTNYVYPAGNVLRYGTNTTPGTTVMTTAIQNALDSGSGRVVIPKGNYLVTAFLTPPSECIVEFEAGAKLLAGANSLTFFKTTAFTSGLSIRYANLDGNGFTGVTGFDFTSLQINSDLVRPNIYRCAAGVLFRSGCVGVVLDHMATYQVPAPVECRTGTNAITILAPNFDNTVDHGGTGAGNGVYVNANTDVASTTQVIGGYIQGFQYGVQDLSFGTSVRGTYFERCSDAAIYLNGSKSAHIDDCYHFGFDDTCMIKGRSADGAVLMYNSMLKSTASGGLYDFDNTNTRCIEYSTTDDGYTNTDLGDYTGLARGGVKEGTFTPTVEGGTSAGTTTYTLQRGIYQQIGKLVTFTLKVTWSAQSGTGDLVVGGLPIPADATYYGDASFQVYPTDISYTGPLVRGFLSSATPLMKVLDLGTGNNIATEAAGALTIAGSYWAA